MTKRRSNNPLVVQAEAAIGKAHGMSVEEVNAAFDSHPVGSTTTKDRYLRRQLARALYVLDELEVVFAEKARGGDTAAGTLLVKIEERRSNMLGLNAPTGVNVHITREPAKYKETSTDRIAKVLEELCEIDRIDQQQKPNDAGDEGENASTH